MAEKKKESLINKLLLSLELRSGTLGIKPFCIGNEAESLFLDDFDAPEYLKTIGVSHNRSDIYSTDTLMILGSLNLNQSAFISRFLEQYPKHFDLIVHIKGGMIASHLAHFEFNNYEGIKSFPIDITYNKYPIVPDEVFSLIRDFQLARLA